MIKIVNDILWAMEHKNITIQVIIDLGAAFNTLIIRFCWKFYINVFELKVGC